MKKKKKIDIEMILRIISISSFLVLVGILTIKILYVDNVKMMKYDFLWDILISLTLSFAISYLFFLVAYLPEKRRKASIDKYIRKGYFRITSYVNQLLEITSLLLTLNVVSVFKSSPQLKSKISNLDGKRVYLTYGDHLIHNYNCINRNYSELILYAQFMDDEMRDNLYVLLESELMTNIHDLLIKDYNLQKDEIFIDSISKVELDKLSIIFKDI